MIATPTHAATKTRRCVLAVLTCRPAVTASEVVERCERFYRLDQSQVLEQLDALAEANLIEPAEPTASGLVAWRRANL